MLLRRYKAINAVVNERIWSAWKKDESDLILTELSVEL